MPRTIPIATKREWLESYEHGKPEESIAKGAKRDARTIKRGIQEARLERAASTVLTDQIRQAVQKHQEDLTAMLETIDAGLVVPGTELAASASVTETGSTISIAPGVVTGHDLSGVRYVTLEAEARTEWGLLREHLKGSRVWRATDQWKKRIAEYLTMTTRLRDEAKRLLETHTGLEVARPITSSPPKRVGKRPRYRGISLPPDRRLYTWSPDLITRARIEEIIGDRSEGLLEEEIDMSADGTGIHHAPSRTPILDCNISNEAEDYMAKIDAAIADLRKTKQITDDVATTYRAAEAQTRKTKQMVEEVRLLRFVPGRCRVCRHLGM